MKIIKELAKNNWDFILYLTETGLVLNVVFHGSMIDFSRNFLLNEEEANYKFEELKQLANSIRNNYENYKQRETLDELS